MNHKDYFQAIGMNSVDIERASEVIKYMEAALDISAMDVLVCDVIIEGERKYKNLWISCNEHLVEAKDFMSKIYIDKIKTKHAKYIDMRFTDCSPLSFETGDNVVFFATFHFFASFGGEINGVRNNAEYAYNFCKKHILAHV